MSHECIIICGVTIYGDISSFFWGEVGTVDRKHSMSLNKGAYQHPGQADMLRCVWQGEGQVSTTTTTWLCRSLCYLRAAQPKNENLQLQCWKLVSCLNKNRYRMRQRKKASGNAQALSTCGKTTATKCTETTPHKCDYLLTLSGFSLEPFIDPPTP